MVYAIEPETKSQHSIYFGYMHFAGPLTTCSVMLSDKWVRALGAPLEAGDLTAPFTPKNYKHGVMHLKSVDPASGRILWRHVIYPFQSGGVHFPGEVVGPVDGVMWTITGFTGEKFSLTDF